MKYPSLVAWYDTEQRNGNAEIDRTKKVVLHIVVLLKIALQEAVGPFIIYGNSVGTKSKERGNQK